MARPRRIVVCDRSASGARALTRFLEHDPGLEVAGAFGDLDAMLPRLGEIAPDLIALDLETAGADVAAAVERVVREESAPVLVLGGNAGGDEERLAEALAAGALEAIPGDRLRLDEREGVWATALRSRIKRLASVRLKRRAGGSGPGVPPAPRAWRSLGSTYRAVGIGASVGGPPALAAVLGRLPRDFPLPVLVVQHMAPGFGGGLARWLDRIVPPPVDLATDGAILQPGVWMAPEGAHLRLGPTMRLSLDRETERGAHRPSLDVLFESLASSAGQEAAGVVLTGMGRDGAEGVRAIGAAGGLTIAQDERTSAVFGMPGAAIESGVDLVLPLEELASRLATLRARSAVR
ncbi:MAG TPA: chemotaxis protein CheB [Solirubrobacterales bacterium]|nr:chemotaxis protein CheB [Solirubrobacterales bacterium]